MGHRDEMVEMDRLESGENPKVYKLVRLVHALDISKSKYDLAVRDAHLYEAVCFTSRGLRK